MLRTQNKYHSLNIQKNRNVNAMFSRKVSAISPSARDYEVIALGMVLSVLYLQIRLLNFVLKESSFLDTCLFVRKEERQFKGQPILPCREEAAMPMTKFLESSGEMGAVTSDQGFHLPEKQ